MFVSAAEDSEPNEFVVVIFLPPRSDITVGLY